MAPRDGYECHSLCEVFAVIQFGEVRDPAQFCPRIFKESRVIGQDAFLWFCLRKQTAVIDFPKPQTQGIRRSIALIHGISDLQRISDDDDRLQIREQGLPERKGETIARIFPTPDRFFGKLLEQKESLAPHGLQILARKIVLVAGWQVPGRADRVQDFIIQPNETKMLPKSVRVIVRCRHQVALRSKVKPAAVEKPRQHGSAGAVRTSNANNGLVHRTRKRLTQGWELKGSEE
ncbi:MAG: hypothetical protein ABI674_06190 [Spartobacteria bacterium]